MTQTFPQVAALLALASLGLVTGCETAPKTEGDKTAMTASATGAVEAFKATDSTLNSLLAKAAGYAIFPSVGKAGFIVGGSYGRGEVFNHNVKIGYADIKQATFGLQIGAQTFSELVIFMNQSDVDKFRQGEFTLNANISAVAIKPGAAGTTDTSKGVIVFVKTEGGLMAEAAVGGQVFKFSPL